MEKGRGHRPGPPSRDFIGPGDARIYVSPGARKETLRKRTFTAAKAPGPRYAELRCASAFSFLNGASLPEDLVERAAALGLPAVALVDVNGVYGAPRFWKAARAAGVKALVGAEVTLVEWPAAHRQGSAKRTASSKVREEEQRASGSSSFEARREAPRGPLGLVPPPRRRGRRPRGLRCWQTAELVIAIFASCFRRGRWESRRERLP